MPVEPGLRAAFDHLVTDADVATAFRSGDVHVLATPRVLALCEQASVEAVDGRLEPGWTSVGMRVQLDHVAPTAPGATVRVEAVLERVDGRRLLFHARVSDDRGLVADARVTRVLVERDRFLERAAEAAGTGP